MRYKGRKPEWPPCTLTGPNCLVHTRVPSPCFTPTAKFLLVNPPLAYRFTRNSRSLACCVHACVLPGQDSSGA